MQRGDITYVHKTVNGPDCRDIDKATLKFSNYIFLPSTLCIWWCGFIYLHLVCFVFYTTVSLCYWHLPGTTFDFNLYFYDVGMGSDHDRTIASTHGCIALVHLSYMMWMIIHSIKNKNVEFVGSSLLPNNEQGRLNYWGKIYRRIRSGFGILSVNSPYYDLVLFCREIVETALQTYQAYTMSLLLSRTLLTRVYVFLLVLNCWSTTALHTIFHRTIMKRRFYVLVCDCVLDFVTSVGITTALMVMYSTDFDFELNDFPLNLWGVDVWFIRALSEFQIMVVTSWENLATRVVFAMSMISNMNSMKQILSCMNWKVKASINKRPQLCSVHPFSPTEAKENVGGNLVRLQTVVTAESKLARVVFFVWGAVILTLHLYAESIHGLSVCIVQVKPWLSSQPSCSMVVLDCYKGGFGGTFHEVNTQWKELDPTVPVAITVCHCNNLEMPSVLQKFSALKMLKFYNTTITNWNESASLTQVHHPNLMMLYMSRVNMTGGQLPVALQGENLPKKIIDIEFCVTNLRTLPDDFDQKWPQYASIYFEAGNFTEVPASLIRLAPYDLSLAFNPIPSIPAVLFESTIEFLNIGGTLISELPKSVRDSSSLEQLRVYDTNISFFWDWIDPILENAGSVLSDIPTTIVASRTPFCLDLQKIYIGEQTSFSVQYRKGYSELLSNASVENWETLRRAVSCGECSALYYTLEMDDMQYGVQATLEP